MHFCQGSPLNECHTPPPQLFNWLSKRCTKKEQPEVYQSAVPTTYHLLVEPKTPIWIQVIGGCCWQSVGNQSANWLLFTSLAISLCSDFVCMFLLVKKTSRQNQPNPRIWITAKVVHLGSLCDWRSLRGGGSYKHTSPLSVALDCFIGI